LEPEKPALKSKSGSEKASGPWRPTKRQVLWAFGMLLALVTIALLVGLLVVNLDAVKGKDLLSRERIEQVALFIGIAVALTTLFVLLAIGGASLGWTGFGDKTFWDWLQLLSALAIPVVLAAAGLWFTAQQDARQQEIEGQRAEAEQKLVQQRAQDEALQAYLNQMSQLLLEKDLRRSEEGSVVRTLARARTFGVMQRLDAERNNTVARFLSESKLIEIDGTTISLLRGASLEHADLVGVDLRFADLSTANLQGANLHMASLKHANLSDVHLSSTTDLTNATLEGANLSDADLSNANLKFTDLSADLSNTFPDLTDLTNADLSSAFLLGAKLRYAWLPDADLSGAYLNRADLEDVFMPNADLSDANLSNADLSYANLKNVNLSGTRVSDADLSNTNLRNANLRNANLRNAKRVSEEQLRQASSLEGATMPGGQTLRGDNTPNGPTFEDWLKDRKSREEDGKKE
jgi:uncharacterized protein YjbI with pentapeptide repeats